MSIEKIKVFDIKVLSIAEGLQLFKLLDSLIEISFGKAIVKSIAIDGYVTNVAIYGNLFYLGLGNIWDNFHGIRTGDIGLIATLRINRWYGDDNQVNRDRQPYQS
ncbi:MAG: hypothetical protein EBE86_018010 [Hormoscilla sp. GUM202]|nr:hypothetical protein [Hormoscilla sp. GUM202]